MIEKNLLTVIGSEVLEYPNEIGARHLDKLKQACEDLNLSTDKNSELEVAMFLATNSNVAIMNSYGALLMFIPEKISDIQLNFLMLQKEKLYEMETKGDIIEISVATDKVQDYNKKNYRALGTEQQIAKYEGRKIDSQLDILYEELENKKMNIR